MSKLRKLVVTVGALAALAVGGAAFAQAQNASTVTKVPTQQSTGEATSPGDTDNVQAGDQGASDQGSKADAQDSAAEQKNEQPDSAAEGDAPDGHQDGAADTGQEVQED
ncbi:MAG: hypothetical protein QOF13_545 [Solirubrobacterales bacterium]|nr:hypothetical protein [Solirubrobacterales bacterium]